MSDPVVTIRGSGITVNVSAASVKVDAGAAMPQTSIQALTVSRNGVYTAPARTAYTPVTVNVQPVPRRDVNFYDYDGEIAASFTAAEFAALSAMPDLPAHAGLTAQGWNWSLADAKNYVAAYGKLEIGPSYATASGKTEIDVELLAGDLTPYLFVGVNGTVTVDWGDGSAVTTLTGTSLFVNKTAGHTYAAAGKYTISIAASSGSYSFYNGDFPAPGVLRAAADSTSRSRRYSDRITEIRLGTGITSIKQHAFYCCGNLKAIAIPTTVTDFAYNAFYNLPALRHITFPSGVSGVPNGFANVCRSLESVSFPKSVTSIAKQAFYECDNLKVITLPPDITSVSNGLFYGCQRLETVVVPNGVTSFGTINSTEGGAFYQCGGLLSVNIPSGVTVIGDSTFNQCFSIKEYHIRPTTPPSLGGYAFSNIQPETKIYVPSASVNTYKTATGWSTYASQIYGE